MHRLVPYILALCLPGMLWAQTRGSDAVLDALKLPALLQIMEQEALGAGMDLADPSLGPTVLENWRDRLAEINDPDRLTAMMREDFANALPDGAADPILTFLTSAQGARVVELEVSARAALLDPDIEAMSEAALADARADGDPRLDTIARFAEINDLVDANVLGAMNANAAFMQGMREGTPGSDRPTDDQIFSQVLSQEQEIRASTEDWVYSFLLLAYRPLAANDLEAYIAFSESEAGQELNAALFDAFDSMFVATSRETGAALAQMIAARDI